MPHRSSISPLWTPQLHTAICQDIFTIICFTPTDKTKQLTIFCCLSSSEVPDICRGVFGSSNSPLTYTIQTYLTLLSCLLHKSLFPVIALLLHIDISNQKYSRLRLLILQCEEANFSGYDSDFTDMESLLKFIESIFNFLMRYLLF